MSGNFFQTLRDLRGGLTLEDLDAALAEVVAAVAKTGRAGEVHLKLKVRPPKKTTANYLSIEDDVVTKTPKQDRADTIFFPLSDNSLSRSDPSQISLPLRAVETVDRQTGEITQRGTQ